MTAAIRYDADAVHAPLLTFQWHIRTSGDDVTYEASGTCPVCGCAMTRTWTSGQPPVAKGGFLGRRREPGPEPYYTTCRCRTLHMNRPPDEEFGCGALLALAPPQPAQTGGQTP
ncbi:hypothetical protein ACFWVU_12360 [Streptomyces sp. NPDC058686]|uniref:hypothetical protein n=1 Tax=Streptomyces sp. NPDC058686 TaxID=3346599 RepID=UPI00364A5D63